MKIIIGIITYNDKTAKYLPYFLNSLDSQTFRDFELSVFDNSEGENNENIKILRERKIKTKRSGENIGFARAYNILISEAAEKGVKYFLVINPDIILDPKALEYLVSGLDGESEAGSACPKIKVWDFDNNEKTDIIDSCGIVEISALRFKDLGQGEEDRGQYDNAEILGPSGAAGLYRLSALLKARDDHGYFDERFFMYEEDCDLAVRLKKAGFSSRIIPRAIAHHDRTAKSGGAGNISVALNRNSKSRQVRSWAFKNKHLIFLKHWKNQSLKRKIEILFFAFKMAVFVLFFEPFLLKEYKNIYLDHKKAD